MFIHVTPLRSTVASSPNLHVLDTASKSMQAVKLHISKILQLLGLSGEGCWLTLVVIHNGYTTVVVFLSRQESSSGSEYCNLCFTIGFV